MKKKIAILGITGSIGESACAVIKEHSDLFEIVYASANTDYQKLINIAQEFSITKIVITDNKIPPSTHPLWGGQLYKGKNELLNLIKNEECDILLNAVSGSAGLPYTIAALEGGIDLALANKESLIMAGHLVQDILKKTKARLLPVDSEHSAIFQVLHDKNISEVKAIHLTASGGPFHDLPTDDFSKITLKDTLNHPTWKMGTKVTIDSATMMNKGLEVIEAHWLFGVAYNKIEAIIHPQSIIHSLVEFVDGSLISQMSLPSMQLPILYAFTHPHHIPSKIVQTSLDQLPALSFKPICKERFPLYYLAREAGCAGGIMPTVLNAFNEKAIKKYLKSEIGFLGIAEFIEKKVNSIENISNPDLETILEVNKKILLSS